MARALEVMVVEDDQSIQSIGEEALSDGGFEPAIASSGEEALTLLSESNYRALVIDIKLGKDRIRGWDVARRARAMNPLLPVVYITGARRPRMARSRRAEQRCFDQAFRARPTGHRCFSAFN
jgi:CheY-like chemotaxis protein